MLSVLIMSSHNVNLSFSLNRIRCWTWPTTPLQTVPAWNAFEGDVSKAKREALVEF